MHNIQGNYGLSDNVWNSFDNEERELFHKLFIRTAGRRHQLLNELNPECRETVSLHFNSICANIIADVLSQTSLELAK
jgi:TRAP-type C4-dicarboxylate transport system substrate-binding protein